MNRAAAASVPLEPYNSHIADGYEVGVLFDIPHSASRFVGKRCTQPFGRCHCSITKLSPQYQSAAQSHTDPPQRPRSKVDCVTSLYIDSGTEIIIQWTLSSHAAALACSMLRFFNMAIATDQASQHDAACKKKAFPAYLARRTHRFQAGCCKRLVKKCKCIGMNKRLLWYCLFNITCIVLMF